MDRIHTLTRTNRLLKSRQTEIPWILTRSSVKRLGDVSVLKMLKKRKATKEYQALAKQIYDSVQSKSGGMFLWASLVFDQIRDSHSPEAIRESLREAPEGLDAML